MTKFRYLGSKISDDGRCEDEIKARITSAKVAFNKKRELITQRMYKKLKKKIIKSVVWSVALYGSETCTVRKEEKERIEGGYRKADMEKNGKNKLKR